MPSKHGGKREGAGRPAPNGTKRMYSVRLHPDLIDWLKARPESNAELIAHALHQVYGAPE